MDDNDVLQTDASRRKTSYMYITISYLCHYRVFLYVSVLYVYALYPTHIILYYSIIYSNGYTTDVETRFLITITPRGPMTEPITCLCLLCVCHETIFLQVTSTMLHAHTHQHRHTHAISREPTWALVVRRPGTQQCTCNQLI
ncbi:unnamed protein product [Aphis gossypii]|uniref:Uncharacterized protein n=1 Tax=Aphis gossypii TaxID=80765 RepID=A0A9P0ISV7_APHGO|nr:unnamed protein product [Aphis gossypii]